MGTVLMTLRFFKLSLFINVIFSLLAILIGMVFGVKQLLMEPAMGLWPIIMCDIVIQCYQQPDMPRGLCCLPVQIPSKWYPLVLIAIFTIFFGPQFSLFAGMGAGYLYVFGYLKCLETSAPSLRSWEERWPFKGLQTNPSFKKSQTALVSAPRQGGANRSQSQGSFATSFMGGGNQSSTSTQANTGAAPSRPADEESKSSFKAFKGKGVSLGSDDNASR